MPERGGSVSLSGRERHRVDAGTLRIERYRSSRGSLAGVVVFVDLEAFLTKRDGVEVGTEVLEALRSILEALEVRHEAGVPKECLKQVALLELVRQRPDYGQHMRITVYAVVDDRIDMDESTHQIGEEDLVLHRLLAEISIAAAGLLEDATRLVQEESLSEEFVQIGENFLALTSHNQIVVHIIPHRVNKPKGRVARTKLKSIYCSGVKSRGGV